MGGRPKQTFLERNYTDGQQIHEKMLDVTYYQRNANISECPSAEVWIKKKWYIYTMEY